MNSFLFWRNFEIDERFFEIFWKNFQEIFVFCFFERKKTKIFCFGENFDEVFENRDFESFLLFEKK